MIISQPGFPLSESSHLGEKHQTGNAKRTFLGGDWTVKRSEDERSSYCIDHIRDVRSTTLVAFHLPHALDY
jgi:hypothetical protein